MRAAVSSAVVGVVDVDEAAPVFGEFLVPDDPAEPPDGGLVDGQQLGAGAGCALAVTRCRRGLTVSCSASALTRCRIVKTPMSMVAARRRSARDVQWPAVDDAGEVACCSRWSVEQPGDCSGIGG